MSYYLHKETGGVIFSNDDQTERGFVLMNDEEVENHSSGLKYNTENQEFEPESSTASYEYNWAKSELESSDIEIKYHERGSKRKELTLQVWYDYQEQLRDYASVDDSGDYSTSGDRPTRPS